MTYRLKSGNELTLTYVKSGTRGAFRGQFKHEGSDEDVREAEQIAVSLLPGNARMATREEAARIGMKTEYETSEELERAVLGFLTEGQEGKKVN